ncbi:hypothetical protein [Serinicoccus marinus]|uniref:hypothetical protein n=1 Tax=Serinicoccus marinus TaxID=247333 RepID=UPI0003B7A85B|nr:hypothetical protein [Serinicoccus marinus]
MTTSHRARCARCDGLDFERIADDPGEGPVVEDQWHGMTVRFTYRCTACGEQTRLIPPGRDEPYPTRG